MIATPRRVELSLGARSHAILIGDGLLGQLADLLPADLLAAPLVLVADAGVPDSIVAPVRRLIQPRLALELPIIGGERAKSWESAGEILARLIEVRLPREGAIVALGGGALGDLAGFCAAVYQRGVPIVQLPTTLLAQLDSAVGGKSAVNHGGMKNLVGAIAQPRLVVADTSALATLPPAERWSGLGEVAKYALLDPTSVWPLIEGRLEALAGNADPAAWPALVEACVRIKVRAVEADEREGSTRAALNLGHTLGHALEAAADGRLSHGLAVVLGLRAALRLSLRAGLLPEAEFERALALLAPFPAEPPSLDAARIREALLHDKKRTAQGLRFVLLRGLGRPELIPDLPERWIDDEIERARG